MCRLLAYKGTPIIFDELLYKPHNSLIQQSTKAREMEEPLNGDGFGLGWYAQEISKEPATFISLNPAWSNRNLRSLSAKIKTDCLLAHIRAASVGGVSEANCHPFQYGTLLMAHNGNVHHFSRIKRELRDGLNDEMYNWIKGQTDSEHLFAFLINHILTGKGIFTIESLIESYEFTFAHVKSLMHRHGIEEPAFLNLVITNGEFIIASRYVTDTHHEPRTLYHSEGTRYVVEDGVSHLAAPQDDDQAVLIVSEKLTDDGHWSMIPKNHFVIVEPSLNVRIRPIKA